VEGRAVQRPAGRLPDQRGPQPCCSGCGSATHESQPQGTAVRLSSIAALHLPADGSLDMTLRKNGQGRQTSRKRRMPPEGTRCQAKTATSDDTGRPACSRRADRSSGLIDRMISKDTPITLRDCGNTERDLSLGSEQLGRDLQSDATSIAL
jgi:hypothetical protein